MDILFGRVFVFPPLLYDDERVHELQVAVCFDGLDAPLLAVVSFDVPDTQRTPGKSICVSRRGDGASFVGWLKP